MKISYSILSNNNPKKKIYDKTLFLYSSHVFLQIKYNINDAIDNGEDVDVDDVAERKRCCCLLLNKTQHNRFMLTITMIKLNTC
jgi:hypothetical protein